MRIVRKVPAAVWDRVAEECAHATFFHTRDWSELIEKTYPRDYRAAAIGFEFGPDDWVVLPGTETDEAGAGFFKSFRSNPLGVFGGPIANRELSRERALRVLESLKGARMRRIEIFGNPFFALDGRPDGWEARPNFSHVLRLDEYATHDALFKEYAHGARKDIRKAMELGMAHRPAETLKDVEEYYQVYEQALAGWGSRATSRYDFELFKNLFLSGNPKVRIWVLEREGRVTGGAVCFRHRDHQVVWHAAFLKEEGENGAPKYLHDRLIQDAMQKGVVHYDFNPSGGHRGTIEMKERFKARKREFCEYVWEDNRLYRAYSGLRRLAGAGAGK